MLHLCPCFIQCPTVVFVTVAENTFVEEAACVNLYDGNELSQVVPSVAPQ